MNTASRSNYYYRILATGLCFSLFGLGGLLITILIFPVIHILPLGRGRRRRFSQRLLHYSFRLFVWLTSFVKVLTYQIHGADRLPKEGGVVVCNHPTLVDTVFMVSLMPLTDCIAKESFWRNPFAWAPMKAADYVCSTDNSHDVIDKCSAVLKAGHNVLVFPEGTRSVPGKPIKFTRGAAHMALQSGANITAVSISCEPSTLTKAERWYQVPKKPFHYQIHVHETITTADYVAPSQTASQQARALTQAMLKYYNLPLPLLGSDSSLTMPTLKSE